MSDHGAEDLVSAEIEDSLNNEEVREEEVLEEVGFSELIDTDFAGDDDNNVAVVCCLTFYYLMKYSQWDNLAWLMYNMVAVSVFCSV